jgi:hypothetical protein
VERAQEEKEAVMEMFRRKSSEISERRAWSRELEEIHIGRGRTRSASH